MDIDEYLKQKRALETKKELLEAKEKLKEAKEQLKKEKVRTERSEPDEVENEPEPREREVMYREPLLKPWMIWDIIILLIVITLFTTAYFFPRFNEGSIGDIVKKSMSENLITGATVKETGSSSENNNEEDEEETSAEEDVEEEVQEVSIPGPDFKIFLEDISLGPFDSDGKINGEVLVIEDADLYKDLIIRIQNEERNEIKCFGDREIDIDSDFDGEFDINDEYDLNLFGEEFDPNGKEEIKDAVPGEVENGDYNGAGRIVVNYEVRCYFCKDPDCDTYEEAGESIKNALLKVNINPGLFNGTSS